MPTTAFLWVWFRPRECVCLASKRQATFPNTVSLHYSSPLHLSSLFTFKPCNPVFWTNYQYPKSIPSLNSTNLWGQSVPLPHCLSWNKLRNRWTQAEEPSIYPRPLDAKFKTWSQDCWASWSRKCPLRQISSDIPQSWEWAVNDKKNVGKPGLIGYIL